jgi:hypothetical protein
LHLTARPLYSAGASSLAKQFGHSIVGIASHPHLETALQHGDESAELQGTACRICGK